MTQHGFCNMKQDPQQRAPDGHPNKLKPPMPFQGTFDHSHLSQHSHIELGTSIAKKGPSSVP